MKTIKDQKWYRPMEIAKLGLITNSRGSEGTIAGHYDFVLQLIKSGKLKAKNYSHATKPYYLVSEAEIRRYHSEVTV